jgi:hypothetical protein
MKTVRIKIWSIAGLFLLTCGGIFRVAAATPSWPQWAQNAQHTGFLNTAGQDLDRILADIVYDPLVPQEQALNDGDLLVHYQVPLVEGDNVYMESKSGDYTKGSYDSEHWHQNKFSWQGGQLVRVWTFDSDWIAPGSQKDFWEPVHHAVLANGFIYDPGAGGTIFKLNTADGTVVTRINPFNGIDVFSFTVSPLTADAAGNIYYNVVKLHDNGGFYHNDAVDSWLVKVTPDDTVRKVSYTRLIPTAPAATSLCYNAFGTGSLPWPPSADAIPPRIVCGLQRAALNIAPAIAPDGTIYSVTRAHFISRYGYLTAFNSDLTLKWATSLRGDDTEPGNYFSGGYFTDGCNDGTGDSLGSWLPVDGAPGGCRNLGPADNAITRGRDPATNRRGGGRVLDDSSSTPTVAPDGSVFYGAYARYNYAQGHLMHFSASGQFLGAFGFGWDITPGIYRHDGTYSVVIKNNHYGEVGSYCNDPALCPEDRNATNPISPEQYFITQLGPDLSIEWSFQSLNTLSCRREQNGAITCVSDHPHGFEWCVNAPVIDVNGVVYANSEDGNLYAIQQGGTLRQRIFQQLALGAAYTPASLGSDGKVYTQNAGHLFVVGH